jgi:hypothetical protein
LRERDAKFQVHDGAANGSKQEVEVRTQGAMLGAAKKLCVPVETFTGGVGLVFVVRSSGVVIDEPDPLRVDVDVVEVLLVPAPVTFLP